MKSTAGRWILAEEEAFPARRKMGRAMPVFGKEAGNVRSPEDLATEMLTRYYSITDESGDIFMPGDPGGQSMAYSAPIIEDFRDVKAAIEAVMIAVDYQIKVWLSPVTFPAYFAASIGLSRIRRRIARRFVTFISTSARLGLCLRKSNHPGHRPFPSQDRHTPGIFSGILLAIALIVMELEAHLCYETLAIELTVAQLVE